VLHLFSQIIQFTWLNKIVLYLALLFSCIAAFSPLTGLEQVNVSDKVLHLVAFFVLSLLVQIAYPRLGLRAILFCLACFGLGIELVQAYLPHRSFELNDWFVDLLGTVIHLILIAPTIKSKCLSGKYAPC